MATNALFKVKCVSENMLSSNLCRSMIFFKSRRFGKYSAHCGKCIAYAYNVSGRDHYMTYKEGNGFQSTLGWGNIRDETHKL